MKKLITTILILININNLYACIDSPPLCIYPDVPICITSFDNINGYWICGRVN